VDDQIEAVLDGVADRLRELRNKSGRTLAELSAQTGVSISTLSRLESGLRRPTLDLLIRLATAYGASLDDVVGAPQIADPRIHPKTFYRDGKAIIPLTRQNPDVVAFKMLLPGHPPDSAIPRKVHEGYDWIYVLSGHVRLAIGDDETLLSAGEAAEFDTRKPHGFVSASMEPAEVINLLSRQGERVHVNSHEDVDPDGSRSTQRPQLS
jgi:transcriptional regulator with XRE-family HTH domain